MVKYSLWFINLSLCLLFLFGQAVLFFMKTSVPRRSSILPDSTSLVEKSSDNIVASIDLEKIYGVNDLFGTYSMKVPTVVPESEFQVPAIPQAPATIPFKLPESKPPTFITPLAVTLKGVILIQDDEQASSAIVQFNDSKEEQNYKIGDMIQDAQVLKIYANRVILVRSNGQQETLYLREDDAKKDFDIDQKKELDLLKIHVKDGRYHIPVKQFIDQVHNLGQFIDLLDITTVYHKGKSVGCRVGSAAKGSLASKIGLQVDDIIKIVDQQEVSTLDSRIDIYNQIIQKDINDIITIELDRAGKTITLTYLLVDSHDHVTSEKTIQKQDDTKSELESIMEKKYHMAPTQRQIQLDEKKKILGLRGNKNMLTGKKN